MKELMGMAMNEFFYLSPNGHPIPCVELIVNIGELAYTLGNEGDFIKERKIETVRFICRNNTIEQIREYLDLVEKTIKKRFAATVPSIEKADEKDLSGG